MLINKIPDIAKNMDMYDILDRCELGQSTYRSYLNKKSLDTAYLWTVNEFAEALGVEIEDLFEEE